MGPVTPQRLTKQTGLKSEPSVLSQRTVSTGLKGTIVKDLILGEAVKLIYGIWILSGARGKVI